MTARVSERLSREVVVELRRADAGRSLNVLGTGPGDPALIDQGRCGGHDAIPGGLALPGNHSVKSTILELTIQKSGSFLESSIQSDRRRRYMAMHTPTISDQARAWRPVLRRGCPRM